LRLGTHRFRCRRPDLAQLRCELLGLSADSIFSHIAWVRALEEKFGTAIDYPLVADTTGDMARQYGMLMPAESRTEPVRATVVIDDRQIVRALMAYPMTTGRNVDEIVRLVEALQTTDAHGVATPAGWKPERQCWRRRRAPRRWLRNGSGLEAREPGLVLLDKGDCMRRDLIDADESLSP
jgi:alkyl hydroperoxide reductase subunit AhpC